MNVAVGHVTMDALYKFVTGLGVLSPDLPWQENVDRTTQVLQALPTYNPEKTILWQLHKLKNELLCHMALLEAGYDRIIAIRLDHDWLIRDIDIHFTIADDSLCQTLQDLLVGGPGFVCRMVETALDDPIKKEIREHVNSSGGYKAWRAGFESGMSALIVQCSEE